MLSNVEMKGRVRVRVTVGGEKNQHEEVRRSLGDEAHGQAPSWCNLGRLKCGEAGVIIWGISNTRTEPIRRSGITSVSILLREV